MAFDPSKDIIRTDSGDPIPQIWNDEEQIFVPYEGKVQLSGSIVELESSSELPLVVSSSSAVELISAQEIASKKAVKLALAFNINEESNFRVRSQARTKDFDYAYDDIIPQISKTGTNTFFEVIELPTVYVNILFFNESDSEITISHLYARRI